MIGIEPLHQLRAALEADAISVISLKVIRPSLEDAFVALTTRRDDGVASELSP